MKDYKHNVLLSWQNGEANPDPDGVKITISIEYEGGIEIIDNLDNVKSKGFKQDDLAIVSDAATVSKLGGGGRIPAVTRNKLAVYTKSAFTGAGKDKKVPAHEVGHRLGMAESYIMVNAIDSKVKESDFSLMNYNDNDRFSSHKERELAGKKSPPRHKFSLKTQIKAYKRAVKKTH